MVDGVKADTALVQAASTKADAVGQEIGGLLGSLMTSLSATQADWVGKAGTTFQSVSETIRSETTKLQNALHAIGEDLGSASTAMVANDEDMSSQVSTASADLSGITSSLRA